MGIRLTAIGTYATGIVGEDTSAAEIVAHDGSAPGRLYVSNSFENVIDVLDISDPTEPTKLFSIDLAPFGGNVNSVAIKDGIVAAAVEGATKTDVGSVVFFDVNGNLLGQVGVGAQPDMLVFTPDGNRVLVANEGEPGDSVDPVGSISIIDISGGIASATVATAGFGAFDGTEEALRGEGVRIFDGVSASQDFEPEYISISPDGTTAFVTLQEANSFAIVDIATATVTDIVPLGSIDHASETPIDASDRDGGINIQNWPVQGLFMPDAIASFEAGGQTYYITANEGDDRGENERIKDLDLDPTAFPDASSLDNDDNLGRLNVSSIDGDIDDDGDFDELYAYGTRSFTIWDAAGNRVFDSGDDFERIIAARYPQAFGASNDDNAFDSRSDNKGPEPEGVTIGEVGGQTYAFIGIERMGGIMVYDVTDPLAPSFVQYVNNRDFDFDAGEPEALDLGPEGLAFIAAADSPTGEAMLAVANEVSGTTTLYEINIPETPAYTLQILHASDLEGGVDAIGRAGNFAAIVDHLEDTYANSILLSAGDNYIPGPFFNAASDITLQTPLRDAYNGMFDFQPDALNSMRADSGRVDVTIMNIVEFDASALGNHEFDQGTSQIRTIIAPDIRDANGDTVLDQVRWLGAEFPYLSANLDFSGDPSLSGLYTGDILPNTAFRSSDDGIIGAADLPGIAARDMIAPATVIEEGGERIGVIGATTPLLGTISSPGATGLIGPTSNDMEALAAVLQPVIDAMVADGINKIVLVSHLQQIALEQELAGYLRGVDVIIAGGSDTRLADDEDVERGLRPGDEADGDYPIVTTDADGNPVIVVSTDGEYSYVGRLVVDFDANGHIIVENLDETVNGAFATTDEIVSSLWGNLDDPFADGTKGAEVNALIDAVEDVVIAKDANVFGQTDVFLDGLRSEVRTEETNFGDLSSDANLFYAQQTDETVMVAIKNGGGIRDAIGEVLNVGEETLFLPPQANDVSGKEEGEISQLDIENALRFNNGLTLVTLTPEQLLQVVEHAVAATAEGATPGQFAQVAGLHYSFDPAAEPGDRVQSLAVVDGDGEVIEVIAQDGELVADPGLAIRVVTLNFLANGGDGYPFPAFIAADPAFADRLDLVETGVRTGEAAFADDGSEQDALAEYLAAEFPADDNDATPAFSQEETSPEEDGRIQNLAVREDSVFDDVTPVNFRGDAGADSLVGGALGDDLNGGFGDDVLSGLGGNDRLIGGFGDDIIEGGNGSDRVSAGFGDDTVYGGSGDDRIVGDFGNDLLDGGSGDDSINGGFGADTVLGGTGDDRVMGASGNDDLDGGEGDDLVHGGTGDDLLQGNGGDDRLFGWVGNDLLAGGAGDDFIKGHSGSDTINGGAGDDFLIGGRGADVFQFQSGMAIDVVRDFELGIDLLDASAFGIFDGEALAALAVRSGNSVIISFDADAGDTLVLMGVRLDQVGEIDLVA